MLQHNDSDVPVHRALERTVDEGIKDSVNKTFDHIRGTLTTVALAMFVAVWVYSEVVEYDEKTHFYTEVREFMNKGPRFTISQANKLENKIVANQTDIEMLKTIVLNNHMINQTPTEDDQSDRQE